MSFRNTRKTVQTVAPSKRKGKYDDWLDKLKEVISISILDVIEPGNKVEDKIRKEKLLSDESMKLWASVFTDPSVSYVSYERYETVGDTILDPLIVELALATYPFSTPDELSNFATYYLSNHFQGALMRDYVVPDTKEKLIDNYALWQKRKSRNFELTLYIYSDFYEAIFGAILILGNEFPEQLGYTYCKRWFAEIFVKNLPGRIMDKEKSKKAADSVLKSLFSKFDYYIPTTDEKKKSVSFAFTKRSIPNDFDTTTKIEATITWTNSVRDFLSRSDAGLTTRQKDNIPSKNIKISSAISETKEASRIQASEIALKILKDAFGIDDEWATAKKRELDRAALLNAPDGVGEAYKKLLIYCKEKGYTNLRFGDLKKHNGEGNKVALEILCDLGQETISLYSKRYNEGNKHKVKGMILKDCTRYLS